MILEEGQRIDDRARAPWHLERRDHEHEFPPVQTGSRLGQAVEGQVQTFIVTIDQHQPPNRLGQPWKVRAWDGTGFLTLIWLKGHGPHLERQHPKGARRAVSGKVERPDGYASELQIAHPDYIVEAERAGDGAVGDGHCAGRAAEQHGLGERPVDRREIAGNG